MGALSADIYEVQNPAVCAVMQWRFSIGYQEARNDASGPPVHLAFLVAPMVLDPRMGELLQSTNRPSGLRLFAEKFARKSVNQNDVLLALQRRTQQFQAVSLRGLQLAIGSGLLTVRKDNAQLLPLSRTTANLGRKNPRALLRASEKLGGWLGELTLLEIAFTLKIRF